MKILITADLHFDVPRSRAGAEELARRACGIDADALVLAGDTAGADPEKFAQALSRFDEFAGVKLLVPGNHALWRHNGESSLDRYERILPAIAAERGFVFLDHCPTVLGRVGLVGSIGWYDYSLREEELGIPLAFYRAKVSPGAAAYYEEYGHLIEAHRGQLTPRHLDLGARWMDGVRVSLGMSDEAFLERLLDKLRRQLAEIAPRVDRIVAILHHLPTKLLVPRDRPDRFAFAAAFLGSERLGEVLRACEKVTDVYCGHSHWVGSANLGTVRVVNVGSTYTNKRLELLEW